MKTHTIRGLGLCTALLMACSKERSSDPANEASAPPAETAAAKPAPFDKGPVKIALVQYSGP